MIIVFKENAAIDESPLEHFDASDWIIGDSGELTIGTWDVAFQAIQTFAPGTWRWVKSD